MILFERSPWLLMVVLFIISAFAIASIRSTDEAKTSEKVVYEKGFDDESYIESEGDEYDGFDGAVSELDSDSSYKGPEPSYRQSPPHLPPSGHQYGPLTPFTYSQSQPQQPENYGSYPYPPPPPQEQYGEIYAPPSYGPPPPPPPPSYSSPQVVEYLPPPPQPPPPSYSSYSQNYSYSAPMQPIVVVEYLPPPPPSYSLPPPPPTYSSPPPAPTYSSPPPPPPTYSSPPPPPPSSYYHEPANQNYVVPVPVHIPALNYSVPLEVYAPVAVEPSYHYQPVPLPPPVQSNYTSPPPAQPSYQPPQVPVYLPPVAITYQPPAQPATYAKPSYQPPQQQQSYAPKPKPYVVAQPPPPPAYKPSNNYAPPRSLKLDNYPAPPAHQPNVQYTPIVLVKTNYTQTTTVSSYKPPVMVAGNYGPKSVQQNRYVPAGIQQYSNVDVAPIVNPFNYRANNPWLTYYKQLNIRNCPKGSLYNIHGLSSKDIKAAVAHAQQQLGQFRNVNHSYMNASQPSFAARHQIFSLLSQHNARMDEEGLLIELVSQYLADRVCLTKWDRQRYLPQLTKLISTSDLPKTHSCSNYYHQQQWQQKALKTCHSSKYRTIDGFCNNPYHPYWGKSNVCHIRLLSPDYADGISLPRDGSSSVVANSRLPNPRALSNFVHNDIPLDGPYNMMKMQWGQFINHDITNTALSSYDGLIDCCKSPQTRGCWPIIIPPGDHFYGPLNVTCLNFIRSGVCPTCELGPRQQNNKNTAFLDLSHVYGNTNEQALPLRAFRDGQLRYSRNRIGEVVLPPALVPDQCVGTCYLAGDSRVNQHPALTALHTLLLRNHNKHAGQLALRHPNWNDEQLFQEARRINIAEYQMITYNEYFPVVFGPILMAYYKLSPARQGYTQYDPKTDPTTWNEYSTATCRFGHSQIASTFGMYTRIFGYGQKPSNKEQSSFPLKEWFMRPSLLDEGLLNPIVNGLLGAPSQTVDPWISDSVRNHLYQAAGARFGGDLAATNIWRGRDHGLPGYTQYVEYCFNLRVTQWRDLNMFIPSSGIERLRKIYKHPDQVDLFTGGMVERHFPGADIGPTFACVNGIQYFHLKFGDRYYFEHGGQAGSFSPIQLDEIRRSTLARLVCRTSQLGNAPQYAFLQPSIFNPLVNCSQLGDIDYNKF